MSYIFNRINLLVVIVMIFLIAVSINEVAKYAKHVSLSNEAAYAQWFVSQKTHFKTQENCQQSTGYICSYEECDSVPIGESYEDLCGKDFTKGWRPTTVSIPEVFRQILSIRLSIGQKGSKQTYEIEPRAETIRLFTEQTSDSQSESKKIQSHDITLLINSFIYYDFIGISQLAASPTDSATEQTTITINTEKLKPNGTEFASFAVSCQTSLCPRGINDLRSNILRLWGGQQQGITLP